MTQKEWHWNSWTETEDNLLKSAIDGTKSYDKIKELYFPNRTGRAVQARAKALKINNNAYRNITGRRYSCNQNFWSKPNLNNCYWAGFIAGDGCIRDNGLTIALNSEDSYHLRQFVKDCESEHPVRIKTINYTAPTSSGITEIALLNIGSIKWVEDMKNVFNLFPDKIYRMPPPLDYGDYLWCAWLIGYFNADGNINFQCNKDYLKNPRISLGFTSSSKLVLDWVKIFTDNLYNTKLSTREACVKKLSHANAYRYRIGGIKACVLFDFLRKFPVPILKRKWEDPIILQHIENQKAKYPQHFTLDYDAFVAPYIK